MSQVDSAVDDNGRAQHPGPEEPRPIDPMALISYLLSGMVLYGGLGWLLDRWLGFDSLFLPIGVVFGVAAGGYLGYMRFLRS
jgi:ATP synthase protein I